MSVFWNFVLKHWELWTALVAILLLLVNLELRARMGKIKTLSPQNAVLLINREDAGILDLRPKENFQKGHIIHADHLELSQLKQEIPNLSLSPTKPLIIIPAQKTDLPAIQTILAEFNQLYTLDLSAWQSAGLPLEKKDD